MADLAGKNSSLRQRILAFVGALILLSLLGSTVSLYRITEVNRSLDAINRLSLPLGKLFAQIQADAEVFRRELDRSLGYAHWNDPHWNPKPVPRWITDVIEAENEKAEKLLREDLPGTKQWRAWAAQLSKDFVALRDEAGKLYTALERKDFAAAAKIYPHWTASLDEWTKRLQWGVTEYEKSLQQTFTEAENRVSELRTGLEIILVVVVSLSLLLFWVGERALRPLGDLTRLAREITRRGLRREDKSLLAEIPLSRRDEVSQLAREFHQMATALLEREKTVETQKKSLQEQNVLLREMGKLNENILQSISSVLIVTDLNGHITQCNPVAVQFLGAPAHEIIGSKLSQWKRIEQFVTDNLSVSDYTRIEPHTLDGRVFGGHLYPLRDPAEGGAILVLEDLTEEKDLQERLRLAENLAAVGRMSAQVAHEVRNPLHSIGLEAEMAADQAAKLGHVPLKQSLQSILSSVDRLEKITDNYLKLSRLSAGAKARVDLGDVLESVLATYAPACQEQGVRVNWRRPAGSSLAVWADQGLLEQVIGNLLKNSLQALQGIQNPSVDFTLGQAESGRVWLRIKDNGPGIVPELKEKLFTPFLTTKAQGTGLGLSFIKMVVEEHGGLIYLVDSPQGASFELLLPALHEGMQKMKSDVRAEIGVES